MINFKVVLISKQTNKQTHIIFGLLSFLSCEKSQMWYSKQCISEFVGPVYKRQSIQIPRYVCYVVVWHLL